MRDLNRNIVKFLLLAGVLSSTSSFSQSAQADQAASALTRSFETVVSTDTRFLLNIRIDEQSADSLYGLRLPFIEFIAEFIPLAPSAESDIEKLYSALIVGSKDFKSPQGLGMVDSSKCFVAVRDEGVQPDLSVDFSRAAVKVINGRKVWTWTLPADESTATPTSFFPAQVGNHYLVMANNVEDFREITRALTGPRKTLPCASGVFNLSDAGTHSYWAYRNLRRQGVMDPESAGIAHIGSDVRAIVFLADIERHQSTLRILSSDSDMKEVPNVLPPSELQRLRPQSAGIWEASIPLTKDKIGYESMFWLFAALGSGVYV